MEGRDGKRLPGSRWNAIFLREMPAGSESLRMPQSQSFRGCAGRNLRAVPYHFPSVVLFQGGMWYGVDINTEDIADNFEAFVWEPAMVRINALTAASEAACLIVSVDETIKNPRSTVDASPAAGRGRGRGRLH